MCSRSSNSSSIWRGRGGNVSHLQNHSGNLHPMLLSRYFREELKQRVWGGGLSPEGPIGSCSVTRSAENYSLRYRTMASHMQGPAGKRVYFGEFPCGPAVRHLRFHCQGRRFNPWLGN